MRQGTEISHHTPNQFVQYVADNVDHNVRPIDGKNTFHDMGMVATITHGHDIRHHVPRVIVTSEDIAAIRRVNIEPFVAVCDGLRSMKYTCSRLPILQIEDPTSATDIRKESISVYLFNKAQLVWLYADGSERHTYG